MKQVKALTRLVRYLSQKCTAYPHIQFFRVSHNMLKWGKCEPFLISDSSFFRYIERLIENDAKYNFCWFKNLRFKKIAKKQKLNHRDN